MLLHRYISYAQKERNHGVIYITIRKEYITYFTRPFISRIHVDLDDEWRGTIAFCFEPYVVEETNETITCAFDEYGSTTIRFYNSWGFETSIAIVSNAWLKDIVEKW